MNLFGLKTKHFFTSFVVFYKFVVLLLGKILFLPLRVFTPVPRTVFQILHTDEVAERLRRWTANPMCSARVGSNPILVD